MDEQWAPRLYLAERDGRCCLSLLGLTTGRGASLQEAADDLVAHVVRIALGIRRSSLRVVPGFAPDPRLYGFLHEVGEIAACGGDLRARVFGVPGASDLAA
jgi:hypothetical protein